ncbi:MAG: DsbA family protein [Pseudomonadota bacterium]
MIKQYFAAFYARRPLRVGFAALFAALFLLAVPHNASYAESALERSDIEEIVRDYLLENPEIIVEALEAFERKQQQAAAEQRRLALQDQRNLLVDGEHQVVMGNPDGDVTMIEFFDYNCGFCRRAWPDVERLVENDPNLKIVLKEFPVLGEGSVGAARVAIAAAKVDEKRYLDLHRSFLSARATLDEESAMVLAKREGFDEAELRTIMDSPVVESAIGEVYGLANALGLTGTPTFIIGEEILPGAVGFDVLKEKIQSMRQCGQTICS